MTKELYIGIMSGTSLDGVDVVLCEIKPKQCTLLASYEHPFPASLKEEILHVIQNPVPIRNIGLLDHRLGILFAEAVNTFLDKEKIDAMHVRAIGSHGQTLWHETESETPFTMQLGDPSIIAARTYIKTIADFRRKDVAQGGTGAPFAPAFHQFMFGNTGYKVAVINIGGMANISILGKKLLGYDTGPGNVLMDLWTAKHKGLPYDKDGAWAREGSVSEALLKRMLQDPYFSAPYPKSTGREKFNRQWLQQLLDMTAFADIPAMDVQRTLLELSAKSIADAIKTFDLDIVMFSGGGAKNTFLIERLSDLLPASMQINIIEQADTLEAMAFAWLAYKRLHKGRVRLSAVTGAKVDTILGGVYEWY
jgi:anhydro-N-acetylmuramic acid kinase